MYIPSLVAKSRSIYSRVTGEYIYTYSTLLSTLHSNQTIYASYGEFSTLQASIRTRVVSASYSMHDKLVSAHFPTWRRGVPEYTLSLLG